MVRKTEFGVTRQEKYCPHCAWTTKLNPDMKKPTMSTCPDCNGRLITVDHPYPRKIVAWLPADKELNEMARDWCRRVGKNALKALKEAIRVAEKDRKRREVKLFVFWEFNFDLDTAIVVALSAAAAKQQIVEDGLVESIGELPEPELYNLDGSPIYYSPLS